MMIKVEMLCNTNYQGYKKAGEVHSVSDDIARRWHDRGIAKIVELDADTDTIPYSKMKAKQLYELCLERGIEVEEKKSKEYYIEALEAVNDTPDGQPQGDESPDGNTEE